MKKQILILDDDASVRDSVQKVLADAGYQVVLAADGREGLAKLRAQSVDLLLLDLDLPDLTGFDILDVVRERVPSVPAIILTGVAEQCPPGSLLGAAALLHKPVDVLLLLNTVEMLLTQGQKKWVQMADHPIGRTTNQFGKGRLPTASFRPLQTLGWPRRSPKSAGA